MNAYRSIPRAKTILGIIIIATVFLTACDPIKWPWLTRTEKAYVEATIAADAAMATQIAVGLTPGAPAGATPMPGATSVAPTAAPTAGLLVTALQWTPWDLNNLVIPGTTVVRPTKPFEGEIPMPVLPGTVYQLKTDLDDTNPAGTWKPGSLVYEYDIPGGWQPQYIGAQGDTSVSLCWQREEKDGNPNTEETQVLIKTMNGNGASALVSFIPNSSPPAIGSRCAAAP